MIEQGAICQVTKCSNLANLTRTESFGKVFEIETKLCETHSHLVKVQDVVNVTLE